MEEPLRESQERFETAFEHAPIGMALVAPGGHLLRVNRAMCEVLGYTESELRRKTFRDIVHPDDIEAELQDARRLLSGATDAYQTERRYVHRNGTSVWVLQSVSLVRNGAGDPMYFVSQVQDVTERKALEERLAHLAYYDPLTGLPNRILLKERLQRAFARSDRHGKPVAVLYLDLDGFKEVNDSLGHEAGDRLLVRWARHLESQFRSVDTVARLGGDEFCVLLEDVADEAEVASVTDRVRERLEEPIDLDGRSVSLVASIGVAVRNPGDDLLEDQLVREADAAMYRTKRDRGRPRKAPRVSPWKGHLPDAES
jgi:diguanylate cyclase (GGDEF)-like protein/PAS domain S-box-containing protein